MVAGELLRILAQIVSVPATTDILESICAPNAAKYRKEFAEQQKITVVCPSVTSFQLDCNPPS